MERIRMVANPSPHIMAVAKGAQKMDLPPTPKAMGANPQMVVREVRIIGRMSVVIVAGAFIWYPKTASRTGAQPIQLWLIRTP